MVRMGLTFDKILVIMVIAMFLLGPERLPGYAKKLGELVRKFKHMADGAKDRLQDEMGPDFEEIDWKQLDPRQYDPRRIIREALEEDEREARLSARRERSESARTAAASTPSAETHAPDAAALDAVTPGDGALRFDDEAT